MARFVSRTQRGCYPNQLLLPLVSRGGCSAVPVLLEFSGTALSIDRLLDNS